MLALASALGALILVGSIGLVVAHFWIGAGAGKRFLERGFTGWAIQGWGVPAVLVFLLNTGWVATVPPLLVGRGSGGPGSAAWLRALPDRMSGPWVVMASWWGAVSLCWLLVVVVRSIEDRAELRKLVAFWGLATGPFALLLMLAGGGWTVGFALMIPLGVVLQGVMPLLEVRPPQPSYARVIAHIKQGRTLAAEQAVLEELERAPEDWEGWLLLAELYAEHFHDLALAEQTVRDLCDQPNVPALQISLALHRLADWHLKLGDDPVGARRALEGLERRLPDSHFARMAQQRAGQLPHDRAELLEQRKPRTLRLPSLKDPLDEGKTAGGGGATVAEAAARANRLVERLERNPNDPAPREELARLLVEPLGRVAEGMEQIRLLLGLPDGPAERRPEWLATLAAWQLQYGAERSAARSTLETILMEYPESPQALAARRRLTVMDLASKAASPAGAPLSGEPSRRDAGPEVPSVRI